MSFVFLWTDIMVWLLVLVLIGAVRSIRQSKQSRKQWTQIFQSPVAMASAIILSFYLVFALLDSIHFEFTQNSSISAQASTIEGQVKTATNIEQGGVLSVLDLIFSHLKENTERTYSAPFATHEHSTSISYDEDGNVSQQYLPLKFGGQHLKENTKVFDDFMVKSSIPFLFSFFILAIIAFIHSWFNFKKYAIKTLDGLYEYLPIPEPHMPWKTVYFTLFILFFAVSWFYYLSQYYHVLGTDKVGQDVLYQSIKSIRTGVLIGLLTTLVMLPLALILGISAGYFKGWVDDVIQYLYTTLNSIPGVLLIAAGVLVMQVIIGNNPDWFSSTEERADLRLLFLIFILGLTSWTGLCRLLRAETLKISQVEYVAAAKTVGVGPFKIIKNHIMPNLMHLILIALVLDFSGLVLAEAVLSYVGVGVDPTTASWGNMINQARLEMAREPMVWWSLFSAFTFMFTLVLAANLFSDRVQVVLDPRRAK
ncbi:MAG: peptide/nickel transport system permease protein [Thiomicrorhabdus sp.]|nr:MAG: peptide/nickel transport system permease protein [Thiomicrorhabdus sp.]